MNDHEKISLVTGKGSWHVGNEEQILVCDGPHGLRKQEEHVAENNDSIISTCYPTAVTLASSWDEELISRVADALANECIKEDVSVLLGPGINIKRSPFGGRNFEYYSEDPFLDGRIGTAFVKALEGRGVGTSLKHFAGNSQERYRMLANSMIDERALHEIYLRAFEMVVKQAHPSTVMASYNRLNGVYACENRKLLMDILRKSWGFEGAVISDWGACTDLPASLKAGMDLEMPDSVGFHRPLLEQALKEDKDGSMQEALDRAAGKVEQLIRSRSVKNPMRHFEAGTDCHAVSLQAALGGAVLLKNNQILPLKKGTSVYAAGPLYQKMRIQGGGSSHIHVRKEPDMKAALNETFRVSESIEQADCILYSGGLSDESEGEGFDRTSLELPEDEKQEIRHLLDTGKPVVFLAFAGSPFLIPWRDELSAILYMGLPGEAADEALIRLLDGETSPSGKLAETWPLSYEDVPCHDTFAKDTKDIPYRESIFVGYRCYDTFGIPVQYCFGHGLSYTSFAYSDLQCKDGHVSLSVENTGKCEGAEVIQIYIQNPQSAFLREARSLRGFRKVFLKPGEKRTVDIPLDDHSFRIWSKDAQDFITVSGDYVVQAGSSIQDIRLEKTIHVDGMNVDRDDRKEYPGYYAEPGKLPAFPLEEFERLYGKPFSDFSHWKKGTYNQTASLREMGHDSLLARILMKIADREIPKMFLGKARDDPEVRMSEEFILDGTIDAAAIQSGVISQKLVSAVIDEANGHPLKAIGDLMKGDRK